ncbi:MAG: tRNA-intron lyase [Nanoarchaeota archaeon]|nr:tRNA-intron lyase [Nanoarchaeota archaeon]
MKRINKVTFVNRQFQIESEADFKSLQTRGYGYQLGSTYLLFPYEAAYLLEIGRVEIKKKNTTLTINEVLSLKEINTLEYQVYKDLRSKGYYLGSGLKFGCDFRVYEKGHKKDESHSKWLVKIVKDSQKLSFKDFASNIRVGHSTNKKMLYAIIDFEGSISYYESDWVNIV